MQLRRHLVLLIVLCVVALVCVLVILGRWLWPQVKQEVSAAPRHPTERTIASPARHRSDSPSVSASRTSQGPESFNHRLRCTQYRLAFADQLDPEVLSLLCDRKPLDALKLLSSMAQTGDERARIGLALLGKVGGLCDALKPPPTFPNYAVSAIKRAREKGATRQTLQRLSAVLAEEEMGPTAEELEACRRSAIEFKKLRPAMLDQFASSLGRSVETLKSENETDVQIEYDRKMLVAGDAGGQLKLANELLQKGTADSQIEALALLRQAASTSPAAKAGLARCLLNGCPTPAPDPTEARQLLADAGLAGDLAALAMLSGATDPQFVDPGSILPASEQYAWSQFRERLNEEGCFGTSQYLGWAIFPTSPPPPDLMAMSPTDSTAAEARAAELVAKHLDKTRALLGCN